MSNSPVAKKSKMTSSINEDDESESPGGILNWTPHKIVIYDESGQNVLKTYEPSEGGFARMEQSEQVADDALSLRYFVPVASAPRYVSMTLPDDDAVCDASGTIRLKTAHTGVIVSMPVGQDCMRMQENGDFSMSFDVLGPDTSPGSAVRDDEGNTLGVRRLIVYAKKQTQ